MSSPISVDGKQIVIIADARWARDSSPRSAMAPPRAGVKDIRMRVMV
jgi:hypothetical protein